MPSSSGSVSIRSDDIELREVGTLSLSDGFGESASGRDVCFCERRRGVVVWQ